MVLRAATALKLLGIVGLVALFVVTLNGHDLSDMLEARSLESWLGSAGFFAPLAFMLVMAAAVVISPIPSLPLDIVAGKLFGPVLGAFYAAQRHLDRPSWPNTLAYWSCSAIGFLSNLYYVHAFVALSVWTSLELWRREGSLRAALGGNTDDQVGSELHPG